MTFGKTDEFGHRAVEDIVTPNDYQATLMHLFGLDHSELVYEHSGLRQVITNGRESRVVEEII